MGQINGPISRRDLGPISDDQLLIRFLADRDEPSFEALVIRHGPRVLGVCRQVLGDTQDAEDAFQATFLVLLRRADAIRKRDSLGHWLHGVAHRIAVRAKARASRRHAHELGIEEASAVHPGDDLDRRELRPLLREEVDRLPEKYRDPVVLCYLEGLTNEEAARQLRCPPGTLKGRLTRARAILRDRLDRRGLALAFGALAIDRGDEAMSADVPGRLIRATVAASALPETGRSLPASRLPARVAEMVEGALWDLALRRTLHVTAVATIALAAVVAALFSIGRANVSGPSFGRGAPASIAVAEGLPDGSPIPATAGDCQGATQGP